MNSVNPPPKVEHFGGATRMHALANVAVVEGVGLDELDLGEGNEPQFCPIIKYVEQQCEDLSHLGRGDGTDEVDPEHFISLAICSPPILRVRWNLILIQGIRQLSKEGHANLPLSPVCKRSALQGVISGDYALARETVHRLRHLALNRAVN